MDTTIKIRAHHLLCLQGYQGYGYSNGFVDDLERIQKFIMASSDLEVQVVAENDLICNCCPNRGETGCQKDANANKRIQSMDLKILERLNLKPGTKDITENFLNLINTNFKTYLNIQDICGNCQWTEKCLWYQRIANR
jgi:hypothetical protein